MTDSKDKPTAFEVATAKAKLTDHYRVHGMEKAAAEKLLDDMPGPRAVELAAMIESKP